MLEKWNTITGFPDKVKVSNLGRIMSNNKLLKGELCTNGYVRIKVSHNGVIYRELLHRLIAKAFIPNPYEHPVVNHKDGNKQNNNVTNLEWCTYGHNLAHSYQIGARTAIGEHNNHHKLTEADVTTIRRVYEKRSRTSNSRILADIYGVDPKTILDVVNYKNWKHV